MALSTARALAVGEGEEAGVVPLVLVPVAVPVAVAVREVRGEALPRALPVLPLPSAVPEGTESALVPTVAVGRLVAEKVGKGKEGCAEGVAAAGP